MPLSAAFLHLHYIINAQKIQPFFSILRAEQNKSGADSRKPYNIYKGKAKHFTAFGIKKTG